MLNLAAETAGLDRYTLHYTQYDLFGTRASHIRPVVSYLNNPARQSGIVPVRTAATNGATATT